MNYSQFLLLAERYYKPTEALPSGRSPMQKFFSKSERLRKKGNIDQSNRLEGKFGKVKRGADNPELDKTPHRDLEISQDGSTTKFHHKPSKVTYYVSNTQGGHSIAWHHQNEPKTDRERRSVITNAKKVWSQHIEPRFGHGAILRNNPDENERDSTKNTRAKVYKKYGFGNTDIYGDQYAKVGRPPSPKQAAKGKKRLKPMESPSSGAGSSDYDD